MYSVTFCGQKHNLVALPSLATVLPLLPIGTPELRTKQNESSFGGKVEYRKLYEGLYVPMPAKPD